MNERELKKEVQEFAEIEIEELEDEELMSKLKKALNHLEKIKNKQKNE